jgi:hypothetical protein
MNVKASRFVLIVVRKDGNSAVYSLVSSRLRSGLTHGFIVLLFGSSAASQVQDGINRQRLWQYHT